MLALRVPAVRAPAVHVCVVRVACTCCACACCACLRCARLRFPCSCCVHLLCVLLLCVLLLCVPALCAFVLGVVCLCSARLHRADFVRQRRRHHFQRPSAPSDAPKNQADISPHDLDTSLQPNSPPSPTAFLTLPLLCFSLPCLVTKPLVCILLLTSINTVPGV